MRIRLFSRRPVAAAAGFMLLALVLGVPRHAWAQG